MTDITPTRSLELAAKAWRPGVKMQTIIVDGWSRGFVREQTLHECIQAGYSACLAGPAIDKRWQQMDEEYARHQEAVENDMIDDLFDRSNHAPGDVVTASAQCEGHTIPLQDKRSAKDKAEAIQRYEAYWAKDLTRLHHHVPCPNPACGESLRINRPPKKGGEMWDSLASCPFCNGTFFYESRHLGIELAFKGFF